MKDIKITELKKYLSNKTEKELIKEIVEHFKLSHSVKRYYNMKISPEYEDFLVEEYKSKIEKQFCPPFFPSFKEIKIMISDFKKLSKNHENIADLMLFVVEMGVGFTNTYGDINQNFYSSVENMYVKTLEYINNNNIESEYVERCRQVMEESLGIGWGFGDYMEESFYNYF
ncbi:MAG: DUF6155 family protein [Bacillota bacterium]|nr:DUF6155 family protein [Bacillota bacterium]